MIIDHYWKQEESDKKVFRKIYINSEWVIFTISFKNFGTKYNISFLHRSAWIQIFQLSEKNMTRTFK